MIKWLESHPHEIEGDFLTPFEMYVDNELCAEGSVQWNPEFTHCLFHITFSKWTPRVCKEWLHDVEEIKHVLKELGHDKIMALKTGNKEELLKWLKFCKLSGMEEVCDHFDFWSATLYL